MKPLTITIILCLITVVPFSLATAAGTPSADVVVLTAADVQDAVDIEAAIQAATAYGTRPGTVILDGSRGPFIYSGIDHTINIFHSNISLRGVRGAVLPGGVFFDDLPADNILIENLTFSCLIDHDDCLTSWGEHRNVTLRGNLIMARHFGIQVAQTQGWTITQNTVQAEGVAVHILEASEISVMNNHLSGNIPLQIEASGSCKAIQNAIQAGWQGILLAREAWGNKVIANSIIGVQAAGIALEPDTVGNKVHGNKVLCAAGSACLTVDISPAALAVNAVSGNQP